LSTPSGRVRDTWDSRHKRTLVTQIEKRGGPWGNENVHDSKEPHSLKIGRSEQKEEENWGKRESVRAKAKTSIVGGVWGEKWRARSELWTVAR